MDLLVAEIIQRFYALLWPMTRISAFLLAAPFFSLQSVTVRIRVLFALALTLMIYPLVDWPYIEPTCSVRPIKTPIKICVSNSLRPAAEVGSM